MTATLPLTVNLDLMSGDYRVLLVEVKEQDGSALNLTGKTLTYAIATSPAAAADVTKTVGSGITVTDATGGRIQIELLSADTEDLSGDYLHELELQEGSNRFTLMRGRVRFFADLIKES